MAWTNYYVTAGASGSGTGTSAAPWTLAQAIAGATSESIINIQAGTYANGGTSLTWSVAGLTTGPIWWRGYKTTPGDQDANNLANPGVDIPSISWTGTAFGTVSGAYQIFSNIDFVSGNTNSSGTIKAAGNNCRFYRCRFRNTYAGSGGWAVLFGGNGTSLVACYCSATASGSYCLNAASPANIKLLGCVVNGGIVGLTTGAGQITVGRSLFYGQAGDSITSAFVSQYLNIYNCSIYNTVGNGINSTATPTYGILQIENCYIELANQAGKAGITNSSGTNTSNLLLVNNAYYGCPTNIVGIPDSFAIYDLGTLAGSGFVNAAGGDFTPSSYLKGTGFPGAFETLTTTGYPDLGAVQSQGGSSGGIIGSRIFSGF